MSDQFFDSAAYEDLLAAAMYGHSLSEAQKLIADFAHELAEKQRAIPMGAPPAARIRDLVADAIDPEVA